ncbi:SRPBCC family protein [Salinisphaera sp. SPP-AMP-43]|uniref:SRPBCC family protein n=1 Tax=Salinisphaera sp. SPP-AMP-43 TaxID=3121288 RepID=UPI003C6E35ED
MLLAAWAAVALASSTEAATVEDLSVTHPDPAYRVVAHLRLQATRDAAFAAATEFERIAARSPMIESSRRLSDHELASRMRLCVMWYCKTVRQVMRYRRRPPGRLDMQVVPGQGDLKAGAAHWEFAAAGPEHTTVVFEARMVPDFWVPPMIGSWALSQALHKQIEATAKAIEDIAAESRVAPRNTSDMP